MAADFNVQFLIDRKNSTLALRLTDASSFVDTAIQGLFKVTYPTNHVEENTDSGNPDTSLIGESVDYPLFFDASNDVYTGTYTILYSVINDGTPTSVQKQFSLDWVEPDIEITNNSDSALPKISFEDTSSYSTGSFNRVVDSKTLSCDFPDTSELDPQTESTTSDTLDVVNGSDYYEGQYSPEIDLEMTYTSQVYSYLTVKWLDEESFDFTIRRVPLHSELVDHISTFKTVLDGFKETNTTQYRIFEEEFDNITALYTVLIEKIRFDLGEGTEDILTELIDRLNIDYSLQSFQSTPISSFQLQYDSYSGITGSGTVNAIPKFVNTMVLGDSILTINGSDLQIGGSVAATNAYRYFTDGTTQSEADNNLGVFKFRGSSDVSVAVQSNDATHGDNLLIGLEDTGVTAGGYGDSDNIPIVQVDAKGRITSVSTVAINADQFLNIEEVGANVQNTVAGSGYFQWEDIRIDGSAVQAVSSDFLFLGGHLSALNTTTDIGSVSIPYQDLYLSGVLNASSTFKINNLVSGTLSGLDLFMFQDADDSSIIKTITATEIAAFGAYAGTYTVEDASTDSSFKIADFNRRTSSTAQDNIGGYVDLGVENDNDELINLRIHHILTDVSDGIEKSAFQVQGVYNGSLDTFLNVDSNSTFLGKGTGYHSGSTFGVAVGTDAKTNSSSVTVGWGAESRNSQSVDVGPATGSTSGTTGFGHTYVGFQSGGLSVNIGQYSGAYGYQMNASGLGAFMFGYDPSGTNDNSLSNSFEFYTGNTIGRIFKIGATLGTQVTINSDPATNLTDVENGSIVYNSGSHKFSGYVNGAWTDFNVGSVVSSLSDLTDVVSATNTNRFVLVADGATGYVGRLLVEADISDLGSYALATHTHLISDVTDFTDNSSNWNAAYNDKINSASFNTLDGVLTLNQQDTGTVTVDLDGRYLTGIDYGADNQIPYMNGTTAFSYSANFTFNDATGALSVTGSLAVDDISIDGNVVSSSGFGYVSFGDSIYPSVTGTYDLGNGTFSWRNAYLTGTVSITGSSGILTLGADSTFSAVGGAVSPATGDSVIINDASNTQKARTTTLGDIIDDLVKPVSVSSKSANYTLVAADNGAIIEVTATCTITIPTGLVDGFHCVVMCKGVGITVTIASNGTLESDGTTLETQHTGCTIYHSSGNTHTAFGALT